MMEAPLSLLPSRDPVWQLSGTVMMVADAAGWWRPIGQPLNLQINFMLQANS